MSLKKILLYSLAGVIIFSSCLKESEKKAPDATSGNPVVVTISVKTKTKATSITTDFEADTKLKCLDVFVFEGTAASPGRLLNYYKFEDVDPENSGTVVNFETTRGQRTFYLIANDMRDFSALSGNCYNTLKSMVYSMRYAEQEQYMYTAASSNSRNAALLMLGSLDYYLTSAETELPVTLTRQCFRINLKSITNDLPEHYGAITIKYVFLTNYVRQCSLGGVANLYAHGNLFGMTPEFDHFFNGQTYFSENGLAAWRGDVVISHGQTSSLFSNRGFYAFPNPSQDSAFWLSQTDTWPDKVNATEDFNPFIHDIPLYPTRLVLAASLPSFPGRTFYYPITPSEELSANSTYDIDVTIQNLGTASPESKLETGTVNVSVNVSNWTVIDTTFDQ